MKYLDISWFLPGTFGENDPSCVGVPGSSKCVKFVPFHPKNLPKGTIFTTFGRSRYCRHWVSWKNVGCPPLWATPRQYACGAMHGLTLCLSNYPWADIEKKVMRRVALVDTTIGMKRAIDVQSVYGRHIMHVNWKPGTRITADSSNTEAAADFGYHPRGKTGVEKVIDFFGLKKKIIHSHQLKL